MIFMYLEHILNNKKFANERYLAPNYNQIVLGSTFGQKFNKK